MKKLTLLILALSAALSIWAQAPRYVFIEHFTNSNCSICASRNPAFYTLIGQYEADIHHLSIHPPVPYSSCVFYQANPTENSTWASWYNIQGTPRVALNGTLLPGGNPLLSPALLTGELGQTSNLYIQVEESGAGASRTVTINAHSLGPIPSGDYRLFAAVAEKTVNQTTGNGESVHHDVFRDLLPDLGGAAYTPAPVGQSVEFQFNYVINGAWNADEMFVTAFIRNMNTGEVINSGTRFDPVYTSAKELPVQTVSIYPNPVSDEARISLPSGEQVQQLELYALDGSLVRPVYQQDQASVLLQMGGLPAGIYLLKVVGRQAVYMGKMVRG